MVTIYLLYSRLLNGDLFGADIGVKMIGVRKVVIFLFFFMLKIFETFLLLKNKIFYVFKVIYGLKFAISSRYLTVSKGVVNKSVP